MSHLKSLLNFTIFSAPFRRSSSAPIDGNTLSGNVDPRITFSSSSFNLIRPICMVTSLSLFSFFAFFPDLLLINLEFRFFPFFSLHSSKVSGVLWCHFFSEESISNSATHKESSSFTPVVNPQLWQNFAAVTNREPQPEQNIMANSKIRGKS